MIDFEKLRTEVRKAMREDVRLWKRIMNPSFAPDPRFQTQTPPEHVEDAAKQANPQSIQESRL